jgi:hypothetical protein
MSEISFRKPAIRFNWEMGLNAFQARYRHAVSRSASAVCEVQLGDSEAFKSSGLLRKA